MSVNASDLPSQYDPKTTEAKWQQAWETHQVFQAQPQPGQPAYSIVIPPPNVTGSLHMGHAFNTALIDTLVRYHRMKGDNTLCLPGTDHASIAVQTLIEKQLKAEGQTRYDLGREEFLKRAWQWREASGDRIVNQLKRLGLSADWSRERFTLDESLCVAVREAFVKLYEEKLIYRGNYLVNWCPESQSAVSDLEVENKEVDGNLWHFRYPLTEGEGYLEVATTRPETMLGDTAVAVHPEDQRYQHLIGKTLTLPIMGREIPIIADELVDPEFGTGCVKVTPAHDPNDFAMGQRHNLPFINIMNKDGTLNENAGEFAGLDRFEARKQVVKRLDHDLFLVKVEPYRHSVPYSDRGKVPVEPLLSTQWFVNIEPLAQKALKELDENNSPRFVPERWNKVYRDWLVRLKDWCISRQLWWGHQIPAWYVVSETEGVINDDTPFIVAHSEEEALIKAKNQYGDHCQLIQDPDVLDTWFSSGLWPFSTMGWPENTADLQAYYPNTTLVTGFDIIFFWVARMTMMAGHFTGQMPFEDVYIHGLVRDENGKKMSKSANNGIDPLTLVDKYGTDAVRYTLIREVAGAGQDISLQYDRATEESESVEASRNFANKLWNAARFVMMNLDGKSPTQLGNPDIEHLELCDRWILSRYYQVVGQTRDNLESYSLGEAAKGLYEFIRGDFCDWYIELVKTRLYQKENSKSRLVAQQTLAYVLEGILKLLHPLMPHITEELWQNLSQKSEQFLALQHYPQVNELLHGLPVTTNQFTFSHTLHRPALDSVNPPQPPLERGDNREQLQAIWQQILYWLGELPDFVGKWFSNYQRLLFSIGLIVTVLITLKLAIAVNSALHPLPLISPTLRLIGLGYSLWFGYRYLLSPAKRQDLAKIFTEIQHEVTDIETTQPVTTGNQTPFMLPNTLINPDLEQEFSLLFGVIRTIRNLRAEAEIKPGVKVPVILQTDSIEEIKILEAGAIYIQNLVKAENLSIVASLTTDSKGAIASVVGTVQVIIPLTGIIDIDAFRNKLDKKLAKVETEIKSLSGRLNNPGFVNKAPTEVIQNVQDTLTEAQKQAEILRERLQRLS